jgi:uncharacterized protein YkwD
VGADSPERDYSAKNLNKGDGNPMHVEKAARNAALNAVICLGVTLMLAGCVAISVTTTQTGFAPDHTVARPWPASATCPTPGDAAARSATLLGLMNAERRKAGVPALTQTAAGNSVAQHYACETAARRDIDHTGSDGSTLTERLKRGGISFGVAAENTGEGFTTPQAGMALWMASPGHRRDILLAGVTNVGIGITDGAYPTWVVDFYAPR